MISAVTEESLFREMVKLNPSIGKDTETWVF
jgi:hypothetical protein